VTAVRRDRAATRIQARWRGHRQLGLYQTAILCVRATILKQNLILVSFAPDLRETWPRPWT
jgi:hypothetical protein